jgi:type III secretion protein T
MSSLPDTQFLWNLLAPLLAALPRIGAAVTVAPLFPTRIFPKLLRGAIAISLGLYLYPHMAAHMPAATTPLLWLALMGKEILIGGLIGFAVGTLVWALESVGSAIDFQVGFSNAQVFDPFGGHQSGPMGHFMTSLAITFLVAAGGLQVLASLLFESFQLWPMVSFYPSTGQLGALAGSSAQSLAELVVHLAAPAVLLLALIDLGFGLLSRAVPQLNVFFFTMPIKGALAALMIAVYVSNLSDVLTGRLSGLEGWLKHLGPVLSNPR